MVQAAARRRAGPGPWGACRGSCRGVGGVNPGRLCRSMHPGTPSSDTLLDRVSGTSSLTRSRKTRFKTWCALLRSLKRIGRSGRQKDQECPRAQDPLHYPENTAVVSRERQDPTNGAHHAAQGGESGEASRHELLRMPAPDQSGAGVSNQCDLNTSPLGRLVSSKPGSSRTQQCSRRVRHRVSRRTGRSL